MKRFGTRSATGKMVKLKLPVDVESLLIEASNRSGRSRSFEAVIRLKDHLHRYPKFNRAGNIYGKSLVKYLTMRLDDETNQLLIAAKNRSGWCKTDEAADRVIDHLIKFPDFYNSEIFREADKEEDIEHKLQHQNDSLSCIPGCSLLSIKSALTLFPSNHSSHVSPAGVMIRVRPTAITSTRFTFSGNATAFGSLTAWLRLLRNTVVSIICLLMWICLVYIHCGIDAGICQRDIRL